MQLLYGRGGSKGITSDVYPPSSTDTVHDAKTEAQKQVVESAKLPRQPFLIAERDGEKKCFVQFLICIAGSLEVLCTSSES